METGDAPSCVLQQCTEYKPRSQTKARCSKGLGGIFAVRLTRCDITQVVCVCVRVRACEQIANGNRIFGPEIGMPVPACAHPPPPEEHCRRVCDRAGVLLPTVPTAVLHN